MANGLTIVLYLAVNATATYLDAVHGPADFARIVKESYFYTNGAFIILSVILLASLVLKLKVSPLHPFLLLAIFSLETSVRYLYPSCLKEQTWCDETSSFLNAIKYAEMLNVPTLLLAVCYIFWSPVFSTVVLC